MTEIHDVTERDRMGLRTDVALAARVLPVHYPLRAFIAVNPLAGFEDRPFGEAVRAAEQLYGRPMRLPRSAMRAAYAAGRITDDDIDAVLARRCGAQADQLVLPLGDRVVTAVAAWRADLLTAPELPAPRRHGTRSEQLAPRLARHVDELTARWCAAYAGAPEAAFPLPGATAGFYPAWRRLVMDERSLPRRVRGRLQPLPDRAEDAVLRALRALGVDRDGRRGCLEAHLTALPGWAAYARWSAGRTGELDLVDYLAVRLTYETALLADLSPPHTGHLPEPTGSRNGAAGGSPGQRARRVADHLGAVLAAEGELATLAQLLARVCDENRDEIWLEAYEGHHQDRLLRALDRPAPPLPPSADDRPAAQVICCIDARSEGLRRRLESLGAYETYGFAGFFAVSIRYTDLAGGAPADLCPVLIEPAYDVREIPSPGTARAAGRRRSGLAALAATEHAFHAAKDSVAGPFALAEAGGVVGAPLAAVKTLAPRLAALLRRRGRSRVAPDAPTVLDLGPQFTVDDQVLYAEVTLRTIGLHRRFARLVVLCAHGSTTENNPYQAALDCGACGGQRGAPTARAATAILNRVDVRAGLRGRGIDIPPDTWFVAAEHDTAVDEVELLDQHLVPASHGADLERLAGHLATAGRELAAERCALLPGASGRGSRRAAARHVRRRAADWAQVFPEWGLAGNAAFVVGPREMTVGLDLARRAFLHSYDADADPDGTALEMILTAPLVVAQWISCQYYFSAVAPQVFGAGTKTVHNVVGSVGVLAGQAGDLRLGLPWQSVAVGDRLVHEPMRLLAVVQAPLARLDDVIGRNPVLQRLFGHGWVPLAAREAPGQPWLRRGPAAAAGSRSDVTGTTPTWQPWIPRAPQVPSDQQPRQIPDSLPDEVEVSAR